MDYNGTRDCCLSLFYFSLQVLVREINKINYNNSQTVQLRFSIMFNFAIKPTPRTSTAVEAIQVNPVQGTVVLRYTNGYEYKYSNVSRLKILNLLANDNMSLGFWVQELSQRAIRVRDYLYGNTVATGKLCYQFVGATCDSKAPLPF